ncbi:MAG TPA: AzlD domain-containing protein [Nakamurella sp.]|nr:AzlD domain-containing protein [Nakamurella sp.]
MTTWIAVLVAGLGSYAFRVAPLLLGNRLRLRERTQDILRHAGMGGIAALLVSSILGFGSTGGPAPSRPCWPRWSQPQLWPGAADR